MGHVTSQCWHNPNNPPTGTQPYRSQIHSVDGQKPPSNTSSVNGSASQLGSGANSNGGSQIGAVYAIAEECAEDVYEEEDSSRWIMRIDNEEEVALISSWDVMKVDLMQAKKDSVVSVVGASEFILVDSGARQHVCPQSWHPEVSLQRAETTMCLRAANGKAMPHKGFQRDTVAHTRSSRNDDLQIPGL